MTKNRTRNYNAERLCHLPFDQVIIELDSVTLNIFHIDIVYECSYFVKGENTPKYETLGQLRFTLKPLLSNYL